MVQFTSTTSTRYGTLEPDAGRIIVTLTFAAPPVQLFGLLTQVVNHPRQLMSLPRRLLPGCQIISSTTEVPANLTARSDAVFRQLTGTITRQTLPDCSLQTDIGYRASPSSRITSDVPAGYVNGITFQPSGDIMLRPSISMATAQAQQPLLPVVW